ncbi:MAG: DUF1778 domain-containing protein [Acidobacteriota bacterium]
MPIAKLQTMQLELNIPSSLGALLAEAAKLKNSSTTEFALAALEKEAQAVVENPQVIQLSLRDSEAFLAALDEDSEMNQPLLNALNRHHQMSQK